MSRVPVTIQAAPGADPSGLATMLAGLVEQNLASDPTRVRFVRDLVATLHASDAGVGVTLRTGRPGVVVADGAAARAHLRARGSSAGLLALAAAPLRMGLPDVLDRRGRSVLVDLLTGRLQIRGVVSHPLRGRRLLLLLSAAA